MDRKNLVRYATIGTLAAAFVFAILALYPLGQGSTPAHGVIPKERAVAIAESSSGLTQQEILGTTVDAKLLQAKLSNHVALVLDLHSMSPLPYPVPLRPFHVGEDHLFWEVIITKHMPANGLQSWIYDIDAKNGTIIQSFTPTG